MEYPAYGVTGPNRDTSAATAATAGDRKLAQNAQMYHYQHQKQQIIAMENTTRSSIHSEQPSEDENEEGDYTVYECPGLAPVRRSTAYLTAYRIRILDILSIVFLFLDRRNGGQESALS